MTKVLVLDPEVTRELIRQRKKLRQDRHDEAWEGVYVMASTASLEHQKLVHDWEVALDGIVVQEMGGEIYPGVNVSDRPKNWKKNYRVPDIVIVLKNSRAKKLENHICGGPDFLTAIASPEENPEAKIPFYSKIQVRELLILHRDTRELKLFRHDGKKLVRVEPTLWHGERWLLSHVLPLAFRMAAVKGKPCTEIHRTDGETGKWLL